MAEMWRGENGSAAPMGTGAAHATREHLDWGTSVLRVCLNGGNHCRSQDNLICCRVGRFRS